MSRAISRSFDVSFFGKIALAIAVGVVVIFVLPMIINGAVKIVHAAEPFEVWWPAQNASMEGVQPFKAIIQGKNLGEYQMFWQVDGGNLVPMHDSYADYPHKEAMVDLSGWKWNPAGTYNVTFIAKDLQGSEIAKKPVSIRNSAQTLTAVVVEPSSATAPAMGTAPVSGETPIVTASPATNAATASAFAKITAPYPDSRASGVQALKAVVMGHKLSSYTMHWSVDGGAETIMYDSREGGLHKEAMIDFSSWTWKGTGPYMIRVIARNTNGTEIARASVRVYTPGSATGTVTGTVIAPTVPKQDAIPTAPTTTVSVPPQTTASSALYVDPNNPAIAQASAWRTSRPSDAAIMDKIGGQSSGIWLGGWNADVESDVKNTMTKARNQNQIPTFVAYNIPGRDCGQHSAGGLSGRETYLSWIRKIASGIGDGSAIVILEPDAITLMDCLPETGKSDRFSMISSAIDILSANPGTKVYVDAGHAQWLSASDAANRLIKAGVSKATGFSLNTSNFVKTEDNISYGESISKTVGKRFVVDTSRNGNGSNGEWCNPSGRALGRTPTLSTGNPNIDAFLWVKKPGESDGNCNGGPSAGTWWPEYALGLAKNAGY